MNTIRQSEYSLHKSFELVIASSEATTNKKPQTRSLKTSEDFNAFEYGGPKFSDLIDIINPLHHIPGIGTLYREITGDAISPASKVLGSSLFLGPLGTVSALANILVDEATGKDLPEHVMALFEKTEEIEPESNNSTQIAQITSENQTKLKNPNHLHSKVKITDTEQSIDPVTAWAMAENAYRQPNINDLPSKKFSVAEHHINYKSTDPNVHTTNVSEWARAEISYRKAKSIAAIPFKESPKILTSVVPKTIKNNYFADKSISKEEQAFQVNLQGQLPEKNRIKNYMPQKSPPSMPNNTARNGQVPQATDSIILKDKDWFSDTMLSALGKYSDREKPNR